MGWWSRLVDWVTAPATEVTPPRALPGDPEVYECRACGKLFERTKGRGPCPECDSPDVERLG